MAGTPILLARCGDGVLVADGDRWTFGHQPGSGGNTVLFVLVLVGAISTVSGVALVGALGAAAAGNLVVGAALLVLARWLFRRRKQTRASAAIVPIVVLDLAAGTLLAGDGRVLAPLDQVRFSREMQLASSARKLECRWPQGQVTVLRGDAFGGSIGPAIDALRDRGLRV